MEIKPTYVTFEQAKLFKEKGFDVKCKNAYIIYESEDVEPYDEDDLELNWNKYKSEIDYARKFVSRPEQWQIVEWLRVDKGIDISTNPDFPLDKKVYTYSIEDYEKESFDSIYCKGAFNSPQEAYSAAFDYVLVKK